MTDLARARSDLLAFSQAIGQPLTRWQASALKLKRKTTVIVAPRQVGKSMSLGVLALHWAFRNPGSLVLIISASEDAAKRLLAEVAYVATHSKLTVGSVVDEQIGLLSLSNGSEIRSTPASEKAVRGWSVDCLIVDEAAQVEDDLLLGAAIPTTAARPAARIVLAGSPGAAEGAFYAHAQAGEAGSEHVETFRWSLADATWIGGDTVDAAREQLAPAQFSREYEGQFADVDRHERVIPREWIAEAQRRTLEPTEFLVLGADIARRGGDETIVVEMRGGVARVIYAQRGADLMQTAAKLAQLSRERGEPTMAVDGIGIGAGVVDRLVEMGVRVTPFIASHRAPRADRHLNLRAHVWWETREALRAGEIDLDPTDRALADQLGRVTYTLTPVGAVQIQPKESMRSSPDRADALCIACWAHRVRQGAEQMGRVIARQRNEERARRGQAPRTEELWAEQATTEAEWGGGARRGSWRDRLDESLPTIP